MDVLGESDVIQETSYASAVGHITSQAGALSPRGPRMGMQGIAPMKLPPQVGVCVCECAAIVPGAPGAIYTSSVVQVCEPTQPTQHKIQQQQQKNKLDNATHSPPLSLD